MSREPHHGYVYVRFNQGLDIDVAIYHSFEDSAKLR